MPTEPRRTFSPDHGFCDPPEPLVYDWASEPYEHCARRHDGTCAKAGSAECDLECGALTGTDARPDLGQMDPVLDYLHLAPPTWRPSAWAWGLAAASVAGLVAVLL